MKIELYKAYKTKSGTKAVVVGKSHGNFLAWHESLGQTRMHDDTGAHFKWDSLDLDIVDEWKELRTKEVWITMDETGDIRITDEYTTHHRNVMVVGTISHPVAARKKITITEGEGL